MFFYAKLNEDNICIGVSQLSGEVNLPSMILLETYDVTLLGKRYNDGVWEEVEQTNSVRQEPTEQEFLQAEMLLNQQQIISKQTEIDITLAELLLNQQGVVR